MENIKLMKHHLYNLARFREIKGKEVDSYREMFDDIYGSGYFDKTFNLIRGLNNDSLVKVLDDKKKGKVNLDDICMRGCKYVKDCCEYGSWRTIIKMCVSKPKYALNTLYSAFWNWLDSSCLDELESGKEYPVSHILEVLKKNGI